MCSAFKVTLLREEGQGVMGGKVQLDSVTPRTSCHVCSMYQPPWVLCEAHRRGVSVTHGSKQPSLFFNTSVSPVLTAGAVSGRQALVAVSSWLW